VESRADTDGRDEANRPVVPNVGGGITEVGANRYERWKGALLCSQGGASRQVVHLFL
jgi:hypothetical protein